MAEKLKVDHVSLSNLKVLKVGILGIRNYCPFEEERKVRSLPLYLSRTKVTDTVSD